ARVAAEVGAVRATADAEVAVLTRASLRAVRERRGQVCDAADRQLALELVRHRLLQMSLDAIELHGRQEFAIGELWQSLRAAADADEALDVVVPRRDLGIAHRPVDSDSVLCVRPEVDVAPAIAMPAPQDGAAADVVTADPIEALDLSVRMLGVVDEPVLRRLRQVPAACGDGLSLQVFIRGTAAVRQFPEILGRCGIVAVLDVAAAVQHQRLETLLGQLFGGPAAGDSGTDDDRVVESVLRHPYLWGLLTTPSSPYNSRRASCVPPTAKLRASANARGTFYEA